MMTATAPAWLGYTLKKMRRSRRHTHTDMTTSCICYCSTVQTFPPMPIRRGC
jgi:hypothetical protein